MTLPVPELSLGIRVKEGWEWSFGWNDDGTTGVFSGLPAKCDMHTYREKVALGFTTLSRVQVDKKLARLEDEVWWGRRLRG